jgi:hypothetical protein
LGAWPAPPSFCRLGAWPVLPSFLSIGRLACSPKFFVDWALGLFSKFLGRRGAARRWKGVEAGLAKKNALARAPEKGFPRAFASPLDGKSKRGKDLRSFAKYLETFEFAASLEGVGRCAVSTRRGLGNSGLSANLFLDTPKRRG